MTHQAKEIANPIDKPKEGRVRSDPVEVETVSSRNRNTVPGKTNQAIRGPLAGIASDGSHMNMTTSLRFLALIQVPNFSFHSDFRVPIFEWHTHAHSIGRSYRGG
jgi:hypothetical protein